MADIAGRIPSRKRKVPNACQRCRRQKLKCDINRPCALCQRAGVDCQSCPESRWRVYQPSHLSTPTQPLKRARTNGDGHQIRPATSLGPDPGTNRADNADPVQRPLHGPAWNSSSTMSLVDGAFLLHNSSTALVTTAIPGGRPEWDSVRDECTTRASRGRPRNTAASSMRSFPRSSRSTVGELVELLPPYEAAALLIDTYFDRVHWFMLIFHQDEFRRRWPGLYSSSGTQPQEAVRDIGFLSTFLMVIGIGLQYAGDYRQQRLLDLGIDAESLKQRILSSIKTKLLDIVSLGTLEAVQTCILLGTYYLYHGSPRLASPVCGCGLRVAQALNLHRRMTKEHLTSGHQPNKWEVRNESRKRSWWAIYEIETFSSMTYGYPHSIKDSDYDVEPLNPSAKLQESHPPTSFKEPLMGEATLLSYKYYMSKLSVLTKEALTELYGIGGPAEATKSMHSTKLQDTIKKTTELDIRLQDWHMELPPKLQWNQTPDATTAYSWPDELDRDVGATGPRFEDHIYELQALALKLAYENARILVYRPLLSYKLVATPSRSESSAETTRPGPFYHALETCRRSALRISELIDSPIMDLVGATYAAAFVSIHTFAAGVLLAILSSMAPLSPESREAKVGLHRLMGIQEKLRDRCVLAGQGLEILQRLTKLVMEKELNTMLDLPKASQKSKDVRPADDQTGSESIPAPAYTEDVHRSLDANQGISTSHPDTSQSSDSVNLTYTVSDGDNPDSSLRYIEDPALSEALFDFDQALLNFAPRSGFDPNEPPSSRFLADDGFPMLEQTWIWGLDNNPSFGGP